ncbi:MAG: hypothetical protein CMH54_12605 [Myxococcales bacterium]|nr:hypothetical protein [Myxococcales bacterium]
MRRRRKHSYLIPKPVRLLVIAASGLAVGLAFMMANAPPPKARKSTTTGTLAQSNQKKATQGRRTPVLSVGGQALSKPKPKVPNIPLPPMECFDAHLHETTVACIDPDMRSGSTIDWAFQERITRYLRSKPVLAAAYVAIDIETGEIRAIISHDATSDRVSDEAFKARAPAASIFKIVTSASLIQRGLHANSQVCSHGGSSGVEKEHLRDSAKHDRCETLRDAFAHSRNSAFAKLADRFTTTQSLSHAATSLGFNSEIPFTYPLSPSKATIPTSKLARARLAAGFSAVSLNPVHAALIAATIARGGTFPLPRLTQGTIDPTQIRRVLPRRSAKTLQQLMRATVTSGTGRRTLGRSRTPSAAKSGTLSAFRNGKRAHNTWMMGYFPVDEPRIAFAALVVNDEVWHIRAGDVAKKAMDLYAQIHPGL